ncbi:type II toxin-antitoxin system RelE/ParE family toxin [Paenibacillus silviterrae]|uniref:type II toxin-antitoxin system RelE/ParE family toxin n=1 Tax=Paenibacillus silviterrae TaxID=3242194 RepID=UPI002543D281|nr:type II toxin-antitoxin system RelE/ParE family toxin [Paenibacillus chinjuensis]
MDPYLLVWLPAVRKKLVRFRSDRFTPEETYDFIISLILETEALLTNPILSKSYIEESRTYAGLSRVVVKKFRIYYQKQDNKIIVLAILFPGEF